MSSVLFVTDAWAPYVNGVMRTLEHTIALLSERNVRAEVISPADFRSLPCPTYPEVRLSIANASRVGRMIDEANCTHVHIATEGPLGLAAARALTKRNRVWTTSYHTRFPEYVAARAPVPIGLSYAWLRRFHARGAGCMVATQTLKAELAARGFNDLMLWPRGVNTDLFRPRSAIEKDPFKGLARPIFLNVGRVAVEKNLDAFLSLKLPGTKVVVGDGPGRKRLEAQFPEVCFVGERTGADLAAHYAGADAFVFPSRTDTFGMVMLEAMACGLPVAAFPVMGPCDVISHGVTGILLDDLQAAALAALSLSRATCRQAVEQQDWGTCTDVFLDNLDQALAKQG